jgi:hypothetical protein
MGRMATNGAFACCKAVSRQAVSGSAAYRSGPVIPVKYHHPVRALPTNVHGSRATG